VEEMKDPVSEVGDLYEGLVLCCGEDAKECRRLTRMIVRNTMFQFGYWQDESIDEKKYVKELLDYIPENGSEVIAEYDEKKVNDIFEKIRREIEMQAEFWKGKKGSPEAVMDYFVEEMKDPVSEVGDLYEGLVLCCGEDAKECRRLTRMIVRNTMFQFGYWQDESIDEKKYVKELLDYTNPSNQKEVQNQSKKGIALNELYKDLSEEKKENILNEIDRLELLLYIMKRNIRGELGQKDIEIMEKNMSKWQEQILALGECFEKIS